MESVQLRYYKMSNNTLYKYDKYSKACFNGVCYGAY